MSRRIGAALVVIAALVAIIVWRAPGFFPGAMMSLARPFWRLGFSAASGALRSSEDLLADNESLRRRVLALELAMSSSTAEFLKNENAALKADFARASSTPKTIAAVLSRPPATLYDELIIDLGREDGISSTTRVYATGDILIGRVSGVFAKTSSVRLFSSPGERHDVFIGSESVAAVATGHGGGYYESEVSHGSGVKEGDIVSNTALFDREFAVVVSVASDPSSPFDTVLMAPPVNITSLRWVFVDRR